MPEFPSINGSNEAISSTLAATTFPTAQPDCTTAGADTKSAYVELISAANNTIETESIIVYGLQHSGTARYMLMDIAIGAASSEVNIVENLWVMGNNNRGMCVYHIPIKIPLGERVSCRAQNSTAADNIYISITLQSKPFMYGNSYSGCDTYGANTTDGTGTETDSGGTPNTKGSWVEFTSSCTNAIKAIGIQTRQDNTAAARAAFKTDIGIGGSGSEVVLIPDLLSATNSREAESFATKFYPCDIPAGTRIAVRHQSSNTNSVDRLQDHILYCLY